jgi:hypothetical protein
MQADQRGDPYERQAHSPFVFAPIRRCRRRRGPGRRHAAGRHAIPSEATAVPGAEPTATEAPAEEVATEEVAAPAKYSEAPMLAALVAEGKLPPVEERHA